MLAAQDSPGILLKGKSPSPPSGKLPSDITVYKDVIYKTIGGIRLTFDAYVPLSFGTKTLPVVIYTHGGGFNGGDKMAIAEQARLAVQIVRSEIILISLDYRLSTVAPYPAAVMDVRDAVRWVAKHGPETLMDARRIGLWGPSAGATLSMLAGLADDGMYTEDPDLASTPVRVKCIVGWCGGYDLLASVKGRDPANLRQFFGGNDVEKRALYEEASAVRYLKSDSPAILLVHGDKDDITPIQQADLMAARAKALGGPLLAASQVLRVVNGNHMFPPEDRAASPGREVVDQTTLDFIVKNLK